ncbi:hypothetical protein LEN26_010827 [Aphanomyces euteiches]|nr:hypothetical protein AeMF1_020222 [Aphanomyces euteiches]KAH9121086.1 hypothetical protein LEN26_010827 [Aphanomyces euteiches]KAH9193896.1 hypothetical protein AeNC1_004135 [Aphanomyces euteiches]
MAPLMRHKKVRLHPPRQVHRQLCHSVLMNKELLLLVTAYQYGIFYELVPLHHEWKSMKDAHPSGTPFVLPRRYFKRYGRKTIDLGFLCLDDVSIDAAPLHLSIFEGDIAVAVRWLKCHPTWLTYRVLDCAAAHGHLHLVDYFHKLNAGASTSAMDLAAHRGHRSVVEFLHRSRTEGCSMHAMDAAATAGHLEVVTFLHNHSPIGCSTQAMDGAAAHGFLSVVHFLHTHRYEGCTTAAMDDAARNGHYDVVQFLHSHRHEGCTVAAMDAAATNGHFKIVQFLHTHRTEGCTTDAMDGAAARGHLEIVRWLHEHRTEGCTTDAMDDAAKNGHLDIVLWLDDVRCEGGTVAGANDARERGFGHIADFMHNNCRTRQWPVYFEDTIDSDSDSERVWWVRHNVSYDDDDEE